MALGQPFLFLIGSRVPPIPASVLDAGLIVGTGHVGVVHSIAGYSATGDPVPTITYQWQRNGVSIGSATAATYTPVAADENTDLTCEVTADNGVGSPVVTTTPIYPISDSRWTSTTVSRGSQRSSNR